VPTYTFQNEKGDVFDKFMKMSDVDQYLLDNPGTEKLLAAPGLIGGISMDSGRLPDGFKDRLRDMQSRHPHANGIKHLI
jgi:hypothetical protein